MQQIDLLNCLQIQKIDRIYHVFGTPPFVPHWSGEAPSIMGVVGTMGTADASGTSAVLPIGVDPATGAAYVYNLGPAGSVSLGNITGGTINQIGTVLGIGGTVQVSGASAGTNVNVITGTINVGTTVMPSGTITSVGTNVGLGTVTNIGSLTNIGTIKEITNIANGTITTTLALNTGTITTIVAGTQNTLGTVGTINGVGTITNLGSLTNIGTTKEVTTIANLTNGTVRISLGTIIGATASGGTPTTAPVLIAGTDNTGTVYAPLIDSTGAVKVTGASAGTNVNIITGTINQGSITVTTGTVDIAKIGGGAVITGGIGGLLAVGGVSANLVADSANPIKIGGVHRNTQPTVGDGTIVDLQMGTRGGVIVATGIDPFISQVSQGTVTALASGTITTGTVSITIGTITGKDANAAAQTANPLGIGGTDSGGTIRTVLVNSAGALSVTGASAGTFVNIATGTQQTLGTVSIIQNAGTIQGGTINNLATGTINALASGTITGGTLQNVNNGTLALVTTVTNLTNGSVTMQVGTITTGSLSNVALLNAGTLTALGIGTIIKSTPASQAGSFTATGTINFAGSQYDTVGIDIQGTWVGTGFFEGQIGTSTFFAIPAITQNGGIVGTQTTANGDWTFDTTGLSNARFRLTYASGTMTYNAQQTALESAAVMLLGGSVTNLGSLTNAGTLLETTTVQNLTNGTVRMSVGTLTTGTLQNLVTGTITALASGTITTGTVAITIGTIGGKAASGAAAVANPVQIAGTDSGGTVYSPLVSTAGVMDINVKNTTLSVNLANGTISTGTFAMTTGTLNGGTIINLNYGTINIDPTPIPVRTLITSYGTTGTTGAAVFGTLVAAIGAGTKAYISGYQIVVASGTVDSSIIIGTFTQATPAGGTNMVTRGNFPAGGGIARDRAVPFVSGTNGTICYWMGGAGTVYFQVDYWAAV